MICSFPVSAWLDRHTDTDRRLSTQYLLWSPQIQNINVLMCCGIILLGVYLLFNCWWRKVHVLTVLLQMYSYQLLISQSILFYRRILTSCSTTVRILVHTVSFGKIQSTVSLIITWYGDTINRCTWSEQNSKCCIISVLHINSYVYVYVTVTTVGFCFFSVFPLVCLFLCLFPTANTVLHNHRFLFKACWKNHTNSIVSLIRNVYR